MSRRKYRSEVLQSVHEAAADLRSIGAIDKETMRRFDEACLTDIDELKQSMQATYQAVLAYVQARNREMDDIPANDSSEETQ